MKLSYSWLKQFIPTLNLSPEKLGEVLSIGVAGLEGVEKLGQGLEKVVVAEILEIKPHPNADKLQVVTVLTKSDSQALKRLTVVCGAFNIKVGQKVPLALPGAKLSPSISNPNGLEIKSAVIRGIESNGMLCAEDELGLGPDHQGILILPSSTKTGENFAKAMGLNDTILEIENKSLTHRPDLFNHLGFAREAGGILNLKMSARYCPARKQKAVKKNQRIKNSKNGLGIKVEDEKLCPRYMAAVLEGITVKPSPQWLQNRLRNLGLKPINNAVDITNYVLLELGQPLHVFDFEKISNAQIVIRRAKKGEKLLALDKKEYELTDNDLVIADEKKPIALAGIIGGEYSGVSQKTKKIVIESANFEPTGLRKTSWRLGLRTEAVLRFEKGLPLIFAEWGLSRAIELIKELAGGEVKGEIRDIENAVARKKATRKKEIAFDSIRAKKLVGTKIRKETIKRILKNIGCSLKSKGKNLLMVKTPDYRTDLDSFEDLIEEIIRIYGVEKITPKPILMETRLSSLSKEFVLERELKNILVGLGFDEVYNYPLIGEGDLSDGKAKRLLEIANPLSPEQKYLRDSLVSGLLKNVQTNKAHFSDFKIFEIGNVFYQNVSTKNGNGEIEDETKESKKVAGLIFDNQDKDMYFTVKGVAETIFEKLGVDKEKIRYQSHGKSAVVRFSQDNGEIGHFVFSEAGIGIFEFNFDNLLKLADGKSEKKYQPISAYPPIKRDFAFLVEKSVAWKEIAETVGKIDPLIKKVELFDVFESKEFGGKRNVAFHIIFQSSEKTLKSGEVDKIQDRIIKILQDKYRAKLRDF